MVTSEERLRILKLLEEGKINAEEAARLLQALGKQERRARSGEEPRWLRIVVTRPDRREAEVKVAIPLSLVQLGLRLGQRFVPDLENAELEAIAEALQEGTRGKIVDVVDEIEGRRVEIYLE